MFSGYHIRPVLTRTRHGLDSGRCVGAAQVGIPPLPDDIGELPGSAADRSSVDETPHDVDDALLMEHTIKLL